MLVRIRCRDGNFRFELRAEDDAQALLNKIVEVAKDADPATVTVSQQPRGGETTLKTLLGRSLSSLGLKHGDLLFVDYGLIGDSSETAEVVPQTEAVADNSASSSGSKRPWESVVEDPVDTFWRSKDGKISRGRDPDFCRHGPNGMCDYCMPLEPFDAKYQADHSIKHLSFHSFLRQLNPAQKTPSSNASAGGVGATLSSSLPPLEPLDFRVKNPCPTASHPPYPSGICSACQPSAITLSRQVWRSVDHLEIASPSIIEGFLRNWRQTGKQRFGWMLGSYKVYEEVPMGVKAVVEAIHEPPQEGETDGLSLELPWGDEERVSQLAGMAGLQVVGMVFTDLNADLEDRTKTLCKRHGDSFFLSSLETIFSATQQLAHPLKTKSSPTGRYSSRLVTAVLSGTPEGGIDLACYSASEQGCAMVAADMIEATVEPGMVRIKTESEGEGRYVPDAFFTYKNEYGVQTKETAKPCFPVEYLLVNVTHGFPKNQNPLFRTHTPFAIENRPFTEPQDPQTVFNALRNLGAPTLRRSTKASEDSSGRRRELAQYLSDWHLLAFLPSTGFLSEEELRLIVQVATAPDFDVPSLLDALLISDGWRTLMTIVEETAPRPPRPSSSAPGAGASASMANDGFEEIPPELFDEIQGGTGGIGTPSGVAGTKTCPHCTFENDAGSTDCDVCGLPL